MRGTKAKPTLISKAAQEDMEDGDCLHCHIAMLIKSYPGPKRPDYMISKIVEVLGDIVASFPDDTQRLMDLVDSNIDTVFSEIEDGTYKEGREVQ